MQVKKDFPPFIKRLISIRDKLVSMKGLVQGATGSISSWFSDGSLETSVAYDFFKPVAQGKIWHKIV